ncbi:MAG TPA: LuxR C-terminal-related transcriptional regulator [Candidatus Dormibacteraeota bacterium]|nr:LuxR C-terminal-related transcriptional regulator [Candidatus Dormibacteraeota bacterium]
MDETYPDNLTSREVHVLKLVSAGLTNREIAERLGLSSRTVDAHLRSIFGKIGVGSRSAATRYAVERGLV